MHELFEMCISAVHHYLVLAFLVDWYLNDQENERMHGYWCFVFVVQSLTHSSTIEAFRKMLDTSNSMNQFTKTEVVERL